MVDVVSHVNFSNLVVSISYDFCIYHFKNISKKNILTILILIGLYSYFVEVLSIK